jgi:hypothetical protein
MVVTVDVQVRFPLVGLEMTKDWEVTDALQSTVKTVGPETLEIVTPDSASPASRVTALSAMLASEVASSAIPLSSLAALQTCAVCVSTSEVKTAISVPPNAHTGPGGIGVN